MKKLNTNTKVSRVNNIYKERAFTPQFTGGTNQSVNLRGKHTFNSIEIWYW